MNLHAGDDMKLLAKYIEKDGTGSVTVVPEEAEDMWHVYNLLQEGDSLRATTVRKITTESATGTTSSQRVRTMLTIAIETIDFDVDSCSLHVKGRNIEENEHVKMGAYHTLDLELDRKFRLRKNAWDTIHLERLDAACDPTQHAEVAAIVMHEGLANVCLVTSAMTIVRAKIDLGIPRKRKGNASQHDKGMQRFYDAVAAAVLRHVNFSVVKCVLIASTGFIREQFMEHLLDYAQKQGNKLVAENRSKFMLTQSSSGFKHALKEVLMDPAVAARLADTKAQAEVKALQAFYEMLASDAARAYYGLKHVEKANEQQAVDTLLMSDALFRAKDVGERRRFVRLVESVRDQCGIVHIFSSLHVSGEQLQQLSGVAAILRFPVPEIEDDDESDN